MLTSALRVLRPQSSLTQDRVYIQRRVHAADDKMALENARDLYTRRSEGVSIWVIASANITASDPADHSALFEPAADKVYRHPTFYTIPDGVENL